MLADRSRSDDGNEQRREGENEAGCGSRLVVDCYELGSLGDGVEREAEHTDHDQLPARETGDSCAMFG